MNKFKCGKCGAIRYEVDNVVAVKCMECDSLECYGPFETEKADGSKVPCSDGLSCAWISTEERLPEKDQIVLWWNEQSNMVELGSWNYARGEIITHWMPTPKPPQAR